MIINTPQEPSSQDLFFPDPETSDDGLFSQVFQNQLSRMVQSHQLRLPRWYLW